MPSSPAYNRRIIDEELDELLPGLAAIALEGPKAVGKTQTALQRARTVYRLDDPQVLAAVRAAPANALESRPPILIDEWQRWPPIWDFVRRAVDDGASPGSFLLTGSAHPDPPPTHSGAGRIVSLRMRPLAFSERIGGQTVSLGDLLAGRRPEIRGETGLTLVDYVAEILGSGFPGVRAQSPRMRRNQLDGYVRRVVDRDIPDEAGVAIRDPAALERWMSAYAAATSTTTSFEKIRDAATAGDDAKPAKATVQSYRSALSKLWLLDEVPAWIPTFNPLNELSQSPKHQLSDPALAGRLLDLDDEALLSGDVPGPPVPRGGGTLLGALFEALVTLSVRVYAAHNEAGRVGHMRSARGRQEVDLIVEGRALRVLAIEVKLNPAVEDRDVRHLNWLEEKLGAERVLDKVVVTAGQYAYRRQDGVAVVPLALLGP